MQTINPYYQRSHGDLMIPVNVSLYRRNSVESRHEGPRAMSGRDCRARQKKLCSEDRKTFHGRGFHDS